MANNKSSPSAASSPASIKANGKVVAAGPSKTYASEGVKDNDIFMLPAQDYQILGGLTILALIVRLFRIYQPSSVVFDEVHFGGFASKYIKGQFFMDVHPPLAKLLITLAGWLAGFDGNFDFKDIGKDYLEPQVPYVAMRLLPALLGVFTIPTMFLTLKASGCKTFIAAMGALLVIFENSLVTQSRLILLDSPLIICTAWTALAFTAFHNQNEQGPKKAFTPAWWFWLVATGLGLGATVSVKWVGLFTIAWVGSLTIVQLWTLWGDYTNVTPRLFTKHLLARVLYLIMVPVVFYMGMFAVHFLCLVNPGEGDGFMSSEFQATLNSKQMAAVPADVAFGSRISLRHLNTQGGYLHSHNHMYPAGSKQQQITLYPHKDENNLFLLENQTQPLDIMGQPINGTLAWDTLSTGPHLVKDGAVVKLYHTITGRRVHSHDVRAPVTEAEWQQEVSAYGYEGFEGDANDLFKIEIVKDKSDGPKAKEYLRTIESKFRLIHIMSGCALFSHKVKLPDWGFEQQEVTCAKMGTIPNSIWYVEANEHPQFGEDSEMVNYKAPGFFGKFWELQKVMWTTNAGLTESHAWDSRPPSWPFLSRGINFWGKDHRQIYLIGNPIIWWTTSALIVAYVGVLGLGAIRFQRGYLDYNNVEFKRFTFDVGFSILGWAFHYFPFYLMARQLFLHHYLPALYFAIMSLCQITDHIFNRMTVLPFAKRPAIGRGFVAAFLAASITVFMIYSPLAYGNAWTKEACNKVKLFDTWDWDCNNFLDNLSEYKTLRYDSSGADASAAPAVDGIAGDEAAAEVVTPQAEAPEASKKSAGHSDGEPQVDSAGNSYHAPEHPDAEPGTSNAKAESEANDKPASASPEGDLNKEKILEKEKGKPKPASEKKAATDK